MIPEFWRLVLATKVPLDWNDSGNPELTTRVTGIWSRSGVDLKLKPETESPRESAHPSPCAATKPANPTNEQTKFTKNLENLTLILF